MQEGAEMKVVVKPLSEDEIKLLPFPDLARAIGGVLMIEDDSLAHHLNLEAFRKLWNDQVRDSSVPFKTPIIGDLK